MFERILRRARIRAGLSQGSVASRVATSQPSYSMIEKGTRIPRVDTALRTLENVGLRVAVFSSRRATALELSNEIASAEARGAHDRAFRLLLQLSDNLNAAEPAEAVGLVLTEPDAELGDEWANAVAGVIEHSLESRRLPVPSWTGAWNKRLERPATFDLLEGWLTAHSVEGAVPKPLRDRGIWLAESELLSA